MGSTAKEKSHLAFVTIMKIFAIQFYNERKRRGAYINSNCCIIWSNVQPFSASNDASHHACGDARRHYGTGGETHHIE